MVSGTWSNDQEAQAIVYRTGTDRYSSEVELPLIFSISADSVAGYEFLFSANPSSAYCEIVRWNGAKSDYTSLASENYVGDGGHLGDEWICDIFCGGSGASG